MLKNNDIRFKDFLIVCLVLGYIVIISVNIVNSVYKTSAETPSYVTQTDLQSSEEIEKAADNKQPFCYITETEQEETKMVYIAPYGEKYHYKSTCAGKNAIEATFESVSRVYEPCKKCAKD